MYWQDQLITVYLYVCKHYQDQSYRPRFAGAI